MYSLVSEVSLKLEVGETSLFAIVFVKMTKNDIQIEWMKWECLRDFTYIYFDKWNGSSNVFKMDKKI